MTFQPAPLRPSYRPNRWKRTVYWCVLAMVAGGTLVLYASCVAQMVSQP